MKTSLTTLTIIAAGLMLTASCGEQKKAEQNAVVQTEQVDDVIHALPNYAYTDSLMQGSHKVVYSITSEADTSLPVITDEDGSKYYDNRYCLEIVKDGDMLFRRYLTKADFHSMLGSSFQKYGRMDGLRYNRTEDGKIYFNACVSLPDSDMSCPFFVTIGPDGSYTITPDTTAPEEDEMPSGV